MVAGRIIGDNDWVNGKGNTWDGFLVGINNDFADIHVGWLQDDADSSLTDAYDASTAMFANIAKDMGNYGFNLLYVDTRR